MKLSDYLRKLTPAARETFAKRSETKVAYLYQVAGGHRSCGPKLAVRIEQASRGAVTKQELRSDLFGKPVTTAPQEVHA